MHKIVQTKYIWIVIYKISTSWQNSTSFKQWKTKQSTSQAAEFKAKQEGLLSFTNLVQTTGRYIG